MLICYPGYRKVLLSAYSNAVNWNCYACSIRCSAPDLLLQGRNCSALPPPAGGDSNWLWLSEQAAYLQGQSVRGGIPVCWPWFGNAAMNPPAVQADLTDVKAAPAHGFARARRWALSHWYEAADRVELTLMLEDNRHPLWQANLQPQLRLIFSAYALQLELTTRNQGSETAYLSARRCIRIFPLPISTPPAYKACTAAATSTRWNNGRRKPKPAPWLLMTKPTAFITPANRCNCTAHSGV